MKDIHKNILVSFLSVALFFLVLEALMNIFVVDESIIIDNKTHKRGFYDSVIEYTTEGKQLKPNLDIMIKNHYLSHQDVHFVTDSFGFRGRDVSCGQSNECRKVLFLGDSVTLQNYLPEEYTFVGLLQRMYQRDDKGLRVKIINGGIWDVGIQEEYFILERKAILIKPDIVILDFYLNDSRPSRGFDREKRLNFLKLLQKSRLLSYLYRRLAVQSYLSKNKLTNNEFRFSWVEKSKNTDWMVNKKAFSDLINSADLDWGAAWQESSWIQVKEYIIKMRRIADENNFKFAVICFPVSFQVEAVFNGDYPQKMLKNICSSLEIPFLDILPYMRSGKESDMFYDHCHLNFNGNKLVANRIKQFLDRLIMDKKL